MLQNQQRNIYLRLKNYEITKLPSLSVQKFIRGKVLEMYKESLLLLCTNTDMITHECRRILKSSHWQVIVWSWCPSVIWGTQGKQALVKGWAWGTGMNLKEFTEMPAPEVCKCMWVNHSQRLLGESMLFNTSNPSASIGQNTEPQTAPAINTSSSWEMLRGAAGTWPHPDHSLKLQGFQTVPLAKEVPSPVGPLKFSSDKVGKSQGAASEGKWHLTMEKQSLNFSRGDGPNPCFICTQVLNSQHLLRYWGADIKLFPPLIINSEILVPRKISNDFFF